ncbi:hypothetical protein HHI36_002676 [Cryptolaemus montrouzieri]|uniref:Orc1-like AAA ATPase domain-containing protein n=1 Tax=Cryptolaemus montrouzieri TaxID=559131 RepID=A0ABD2PBR2_9CUCU
MQAKILDQHHQISRQSESIQSRKKIETLITFVPDVILAKNVATKSLIEHFDAVVLFIDISYIRLMSGISQEGIFKNNVTINAYLSVIMEIIFFFEGDVHHLVPTHITAIWKTTKQLCLYKLIDKVIQSALHIQELVDYLNLKMELTFETKQVISCGSLTFGVLGENRKIWVLIGDVIHSCCMAREACNPKEILITFDAWGHLYEGRYVVNHTSTGFVQILNRVFLPTEREEAKIHKANTANILSLCSEHLNFRNIMCSDMKNENQFFKHDYQKQKLKQNITQRRSLKTNALNVKELESFLIEPVIDKIEEYQPLEYLTEICEATIETILIVSTFCTESRWLSLLNETYTIIHNITSEKFGYNIETQSEWNRTIIFIIAFGLEGTTRDNDSQNALTTARDIMQRIKSLEDLENVNITISKQIVHCSVLGHPFRQSYFVIANEGMKNTSHSFKIFCDYETYETSKLPSNCFEIQRNISDEKLCFEFNESFKKFSSHSHEETAEVVIGREQELEFLQNIIFKPESPNDFRGIVVKGQSKSGKSILLRKIITSCRENGLPHASVNLCGGKSNPYYCVSSIYSQLIDFQNSNLSISRQLWNFEDNLQLRYSSFSEDIQSSMIIFEKFLKACRNTTKFSVVMIDNIQFIDIKSLQLLEDMLKIGAIRLLSAGHFEEDTLHILWKLSLSNNFKILNLEPLGAEYIPALICHFLGIHGVMKKIVKLVEKVCDGKPGWIETFLLELLDNKELKIQYIQYEDSLEDEFVLLHHKINEELRPMYIRIAIIGNICQKQMKNLTLNALTLNFFKSFPSYQQIIIKTAAVIGDMFTRSFLIIILEIPNNSFFTYAIKCLFDEEIFECGSKYFVENAKILSNELSCVCYMKNNEKKLFKYFPKYAFCKILHFRNSIIRKIAYELLSPNQKKDLHLKITELLEYENTLCPRCSQQRPSTIIKVKKYDDVIILAEPAKIEIGTQQEFRVKEAIRHEVKSTEESEIAECGSSNEILRRNWKPSNCFCLEILTRIYSDLVYHSNKANHLAKQIFFMYQYGSILILIGDLEDAINLLKEASQLCIFSNFEKHNITTNYSKFLFPRIVTAIAEAYYHLNNLKAAKNYILLCFRTQDIPMISLEYKCCFKLLTRNCESEIDDFFPQETGCEEYVGQSLAILMRILIAENQWKFAYSIAKRCMTLLKRENINVTILCDIYSSALDICSVEGKTHTCEELEKCALSVLLNLYSTHGITEFFAMAKLMKTLFFMKAKTDTISNAIRIGYRLYLMNYLIHADIFLIETVPILADLLISVKRIEDAVYCIKVTRRITRNTLYNGELLYFTFCVDLMLDSSFS